MQLIKDQYEKLDMRLKKFKSEKMEAADKILNTGFHSCCETLYLHCFTKGEIVKKMNKI